MSEEVKVKRLPRLSEKGIRKAFATKDSFSNFMHRLGMGADNPMSHSTYSLNNLMSRQRVILEAGYRSSWLIGQAVDVIAEDMTKMGVEFISKMSPNDVKKLQVALTDYNVWEALCNTIKWARLYGGALGVILIDGADYSKPLEYDKIGKNSFKGILVLDRWMCEPILTELITDLCKDFGKPKYYRVYTSVGNAKLPRIKIHYSRVLRFDGITLPFYQKLYENHWGLSVVERIYDRLIAYDSSTLGASQLMYRAYLRVVGIEGLREALALGGKEENAIIKQWEYIRQFQTNEGITLLDSKDVFNVHNNSAISGAADLLRELGQQVSGATGIPLVRLFGQSPSGFSTGDTDLRNYYDNINREQENKLKAPVMKLLEVISVSELNKRLPEDFEMNFNSLWQMSDKEKAEIAQADVGTINTAFNGGLVSKEVSTKELIQSSRITGRFTNVTTDDVDKAREEDENQPPPGIPPSEEPSPPAPDNEGDLSEKGVESAPGGGVSLSTPSPEEERSKSTAAPLAGRTQSTTEKQQETETDELPSKYDVKIKMPEITISEKAKETIRQNFANIAANINKRYFNKDKKAYVTDATYAEVWSKADEQIPAIYGTAREAWMLGYLRFPLPEEYTPESVGMRYYKLGEANNVSDAAGTFREEDHPRGKGEKGGQFVKKGEGGGSSSSSKSNGKEKKKNKEPESEGEKRTKKTQGFESTKRDKKGNLVLSNGKSLPKHIASLYIAPAWENVIVNPNPKGDLLVIGYDKKGKAQPIYSANHKEKKQIVKDARIQELKKKFPAIDKQLNASLGSKDKTERENAFLVKLLDHTGVRIGSTDEVLGNVKAYGASTMEARHIVDKGNGIVELNFVGKKGKVNSYPVTDKYLVKTLLKMKGNRKDNDKIFNTDYDSFLKYCKGLDGGKFTPKDFRTKVATEMALTKIKEMKTPESPKEYKKAVKAVAKEIAEKLNNTKSMVLKAYIIPSVWSEWKMKSGVE